MRRVETQSIRDVAIRKRPSEVVGDQRIGALLAATQDDAHGNAVIYRCRPQHCNLGMRLEKGRITDFGPIE